VYVPRVLRSAVIVLALAATAGAAPAPHLRFSPHADVKTLVKVGEVGFELDPWTPGDKPRPIVHMAAGAAKELAALHDGAAAVVQAKTAILVVDYPLNHPVELKLAAAGKAFTRAELVKAVCDAYQQIYAEEEAASAVKTVPAGQRGTLQNRNTTEGPYGIWGHDLDDLDLVTIEVDKARSGDIYLMLRVDS